MMINMCGGLLFCSVFWYFNESSTGDWRLWFESHVVSAQTFTLITFRLVINRQQNRIIKHNRAVLYSQHLHISCYRLCWHNERNKYVSVVKRKYLLIWNQLTFIDARYKLMKNAWNLLYWVPSSNFPLHSRYSAQAWESLNPQISR